MLLVKSHYFAILFCAHIYSIGERSFTCQDRAATADPRSCRQMAKRRGSNTLKRDLTLSEVPLSGTKSRGQIVPGGLSIHIAYFKNNC